MNVRNFNGIKTLLFDNLNTRQTFFKNTFWLLIGIVISRFLTLALLIYVARILGATEYGKFSFALAFVSLFLIFSDLGLSTIIIREFSREREKEGEFYSILSLKIFLGLVTLIFILIGSFFITSDFVIRKIILILAFYSLINSFTGIFSSFFLARQRMEYHALVIIFGALILVFSSFFVIFNFPSVENLSYSYFFANIITLIFILIFFHAKVFPLKISWQKSIWKRFLLMSWPLASAALFDTIYTYIGSTMMGYWGQITETGWYSAAFRLAIFALVFTAQVPASFYPMLSQSFKESKEGMQKIWNYQMEIITVLTPPIVTGGIILAPKIINFIYGPGFEPSIPTFQILMVMTGIILFYLTLQHILIVSNHQKKYFWAVFSGAIANIILNLILIPKFSLYGAAVSLVITHFLVLFLLFKFTIEFTSIKPFNLKSLQTFLGAVLSSTIMIFVILQPAIYYFHVLPLMLVGGIVYFICFLGYRKIINQLKIFQNL